MTLSLIGILAMVSLAAWSFGGIALRLAGTVIALAGLLGLRLSGHPIGVLAFALGASLWLAGHLHLRLRHGAYRSALVERLILATASAFRRALTIAISVWRQQRQGRA